MLARLIKRILDRSAWVPIDLTTTREVEHNHRTKAYRYRWRREVGGVLKLGPWKDGQPVDLRDPFSMRGRDLTDDQFRRIVSPDRNDYRWDDEEFKRRFDVSTMKLPPKL